MTLNMLKWYFGLALGSLCLKVPLALYVYEYGYLQDNKMLASADSFDYVIHAQNNTIDVRLFGHWLYDYLNECVYNIAPHHIPTFLVMQMLNIGLSLLLPLALWPAAQGLDMVTSERKTYFIGLCALLLFWPNALWLSTQNLKDVLTAFLVALFFSVFVRATRTVRTGPATLIGLALVGIGLLYLIFSLRSYLAAFLLLAVIVHLFVKERRIWVKTFTAIAIVALLMSPIGQGVLAFASPNQNWLLNPAVAEEINQGQAQSGHDAFVINRTPFALLMAVPKTIISPYPSIQLNSINDLLEVLRSVFLCFTVFFFIVSFCQWKSPLKLFFGLCLLLPLIFYLIAPDYSGPRQFFSSGIDIVFLLLFPLFLLHKWQSRILGASLGIGALLSNAGLIFTSKALF